MELLFFLGAPWRSKTCAIALAGIKGDTDRRLYRVSGLGSKFLLADYIGDHKRDYLLVGMLGA